ALVGKAHTAQTYAGDPNAADTLYKQMNGQLEANRYVGSFSAFGLSDATTVDGRPVPLAGIRNERGHVWQPIVEGRAPVSNDELVLGRDPLRDLHKHVGQTVVVGAADRSVPMRIVGVSLQPTAGDLAPRLSSSGAT